MEYSGGKSYSPDRYQPEPDPVAEKPKPEPFLKEGELQAYAESLGSSLLLILVASALLYVIGQATGWILNVMLISLRPKTAGKFKVQRTDYFALIAGAIVVWMLAWYCSGKDEFHWRTFIACLSVVTWTWVWALGIFWSSIACVEHRVARLLTICVLSPIMRTGILILLPICFEISTISYHGRSSNEVYRTAVYAAEFGMLAAVLICSVIVLKLEKNYRKTLPPVPTLPPASDSIAP